MNEKVEELWYGLAVCRILSAFRHGSLTGGMIAKPGEATFARSLTSLDRLLGACLRSNGADRRLAEWVCPSAGRFAHHDALVVVWSCRHQVGTRA